MLGLLPAELLPLEDALVLKAAVNSTRSPLSSFCNNNRCCCVEPLPVTVASSAALVLLLLLAASLVDDDAAAADADAKAAISLVRIGISLKRVTTACCCLLAFWLLLLLVTVIPQQQGKSEHGVRSELSLVSIVSNVYEIDTQVKEIGFNHQSLLLFLC